MARNGREDQQEPKVTGYVIISLPPADNPSEGKTITAFTVSDHQSSLPIRRGDSGEVQESLPARSPPPMPWLGFSAKKAAGALLGASLIAFSLLAFLFPEDTYQLLGNDVENSREERDTFLFPLYPKSGNWSSPAAPSVKLGSWKAARDGATINGRRSASDLIDFSSSTNSSAVLPVRGDVSPDGQYYTSIFIGNPPRPYFLDVDTGSDLTWIQCDAPCTSCAKGPHPLYKPAKGRIVPSWDSLCLEVQNQNYKYCESCKQCDYEIEYADHSYSMGVLARDEMNLISSNGGQTKFPFVFGCAYDQQGQLLASPAKTDGILGLSSAKVSLPSQLASQGVIANVVGHCISNEADGGGYMFLGDGFVPHWGMTWIPVLNGFTLYHAEVVKISYGGQQLGFDERSVVFDTGSTYTYFTNQVYTNLVASLEYISQRLVQVDSNGTLPKCWRADFAIRSLTDVEQFFEPLTLHFGKGWWMRSKFTMPPESYLVISDEGNVCLGILDGSEVHDGSSIILGDISLRGKMIVYDNDQGKIGWIQADCAKPQKPKSIPFFL